MILPFWVYWLLTDDTMVSVMVCIIACLIANGGS